MQRERERRSLKRSSLESLTISWHFLCRKRDFAGRLQASKLLASHSRKFFARDFKKLNIKTRSDVSADKKGERREENSFGLLYKTRSPWNLRRVRFLLKTIAFERFRPFESTTSSFISFICARLFRLSLSLSHFCSVDCEVECLLLDMEVVLHSNILRDLMRKTRFQIEIL